MLRLIAWLVSAYAFYQLWTGVRQRRARQVSHAASGPAARPRQRIDRTRVVDADFVDLDPPAEPRR